MTLQAALETFQDRYIEALGTSGSTNADLREADRLRKIWTAINNWYIIYFEALKNNDTVTRDEAIQAIIDLLEGEDLTVTHTVIDGTGFSFIASPPQVLVQYDVNDNPLSGTFDDAVSTLVAYLGTTDDTSNWTFVISTQTNCTATIQNDNEVKFSAISADSGYVKITASKTGVSNMVLYVYIFKLKIETSVLDSFTDSNSYYVRFKEDGTVLGGTSPSFSGGILLDTHGFTSRAINPIIYDPAWNMVMPFGIFKTTSTNAYRLNIGTGLDDGYYTLIITRDRTVIPTTTTTTTTTT